MDDSKAIMMEEDSSCVPGVVRLTNKECMFSSLANSSDGASTMGLAVRRFCTRTTSTSCLVCGSDVSGPVGHMGSLRRGSTLFSSFGTIGRKGM